jgi:SAM-dependent methyltransferase
MRSGNSLPPEFDPIYYRSLYSDLEVMDDAQVESHFIHYGQTEGRVASPLATREGFLKEIINHQQGDILEIGPFCSPVVRGSNVAYLDVLDANELRARAKTLGIDSGSCPEVIDFVGDLGSVDRRFAAVISSHAIEHQTDLVYHLKGVSRLLEHDGRYYLIIPDKRYCFDAMIAASTVADVLQAHKERRTRHTLRSVIEHRVLTTHNDPNLHWQGAPVTIDQADHDRRLKDAIKEFDDAGDAYIDVHAWQFTPDSFRSITSSLFFLDLTDLRPLRVFHTPRNRPEFCAILEKVSK